ncbi:uncharacterized protein LOC130663891 [Microplitis mediator]|uniref:uncharacterized protein LOC130663891 n=1 Tax=Microplitis mediator TaxID=375433 RepID=UPI002553D8DE|nr:uncharacterized protein LOC130663891 [Microplitis mediator]
MEGRKIERMFRSFRLVGQNSEESVSTEHEDSFASGSSTQHSSRSIDYRTKYPALYSLEEICKSFHAEDASNIENDPGFSLAPRRLNTSSQKSSEYSYYSTQSIPQSNISSISTAPASDDYDAEESSSSPSFEMVDNFLNKTINDSASTASEYVDATGCKNNPHDTWQSHQDSFKSSGSTSTEYMEIKAVLHKLSKIPNNKEDCGATAESNQCFNRLSKSFETVNNDFKQQLRTILEETQLGDGDNSIGVFREMVMKIIGKTRGIQDESLISFVNDHGLSKVSFEKSPTSPAAEIDLKAASPAANTPFNITKSKKIYRKTPVDLAKGSTFANTPLRIAALTRGMDTPKSNTQSPSGTPGSPRTPGSGRDLNESSFTYYERQCLGDKIPITPKPMPELTEEQKKLLAECQMKELALASVSPYSSKSLNNCKSTDFDDSNHQSNELSPINSAARGQVSDNFCDSLDDLDIEKEMAERDRRIAETEKTIKGIVDDKKITGSYSDEFLNIVNTYFDKSGSRVKSGDGLHDSGVETVSSARQSRRDKFSGSDSSLESRLDNITLRKLSPSSINIKHSGRKRSPVIMVSKTKSATPRTLIVRNKSPLPGTKSRVPVTPKSTPRTPRRVPTPASSTPRVVSAKRNIASKFTPGKSVSSSQLSSALSVVAGKSSKPAAASKEFKVPAQPPMILVTPSTPYGAVTGQDNFFSPMQSPGAGKIGSYVGGKYFITPGKVPVAKKKTVFFPSPAKVNETPKSNEIKKFMEKIYPGTAKVRSPVADYIRGGRDLTAIKTIPKTQNEYLLSKEEMLNYKHNVKVNDENYSPNSGFHYPTAVYRPNRPVQEFDASPITPQGSRVKKLVAKKDSREVIKHHHVPTENHQPDMSIRIKTVAEKKTAVTPRAYKKF